MKGSDIVIAGSGVISSIGSGMQSFSESLFSSKKKYRSHKLISKNNAFEHQIAYVDDSLLIQDINPRQARKLDRFCLLTMQAFDQAYKASNLSPPLAHEYGILIGNSTGGWSFVEHQMDSICSGDFDSLSPYVATAWFPTAPQGEISIKYDVAGYSKTFSAGTLSSGYALEHAIYLIKNGYLPGAFVGGGESPISPLVYNAYIHNKAFSLNGKYVPYQTQATGGLLGEGASILFIESLANCSERKGTPLAKISHCAVGRDLEEAIRECLEESNKRASDIDAILLNGKGLPSVDQDELAVLGHIFSESPNLYLGVSKPLYGNTIGADFAFQCLVVLLMLEQQKVPAGLEEVDKCFSKICPGSLVLGKALRTRLRTILTYSIDLATGISVAAIFDKV
ncbi:beta-ketoacyl synthase N-terminal-like domain-containing protein [Candidatus Neptunichlamydia sp. REUL1]|uniref:beta-ketoacyl synthase N-terminal-like domain-containing protein n=1 Tax=Candidatus Neptunichlamydia sp. REUL1 TaxID=3064277 RepID=UPI002930044E|nr:beta-ketoacyl synthase N-terminal-like domain-containing protein [Candidatus Neptunochlamydia sp. REUL1]